MVEIGPGRGALTEHLLQRARRVVAIELDGELVNYLRDRFASEPRLEVLHADVLQADLARWGRIPIAGNLPYYITSPILEKTAPLLAPRAVFLMQQEVAQRLAAAPGTRDYGFLTVQTAIFSRVRYLFAVKPGSFQPPPKVDSAVVMLEPRPGGPAVPDPAGLIAFAGHCFAHKRKTLRNNLSPVYGKDRIASWPEAALRAEQVPLEGFVAMYRRLLTSDPE